MFASVGAYPYVRSKCVERAAFWQPPCLPELRHSACYRNSRVLDSRLRSHSETLKRSCPERSRLKRLSTSSHLWRTNTFIHSRPERDFEQKLLPSLS